MIALNRKMPQNCLDCPCLWTFGNIHDENLKETYAVRFCAASHQDISIYKESFGYDDWKSFYLDDYDEIIVCGFCSSICCMANIQIIHALYPETLITFVENASAGLSPEDHAAACRIMKDCQIEVISI